MTTPLSINQINFFPASGQTCNFLLSIFWVAYHGLNNFSWRNRSHFHFLELVQRQSLLQP